MVNLQLRLAGLALAAVLWGPGAAWATQLQAVRTQTFGCLFASENEGTLGNSADQKNLSTEFTSGTRPSFMLNVLGMATLSLRPEIFWYVDGRLIPNVTTKLTVRTTAAGGDAVPLPKVFSESGMHRFFLEIEGFKAEGFYESGSYKVVALFNCV